VRHPEGKDKSLVLEEGMPGAGIPSLHPPVANPRLEVELFTVT